MAVLPLIALLVGIGVVSVVVDRRLQARKQRAADAPAADTSEQTAAVAASSVTDRLWSETKGWYDRIMSRTPAELPQRFRVWAVNASAGDTAMLDWLNGLSDEGLQALTQHVAAFCSDMGFELSGLVMQQFDKTPELAQAAEKIVMHYCHACHQAAMAQDDMEVYKQLQAFTQHPSSKKHQVFGETLLARMVEAGLTSTSISAYLMAPPRQRRQHMVEAIREATARDSATFNRIVKEVRRSHEPVATTARTPNGQESTASPAAPA